MFITNIGRYWSGAVSRRLWVRGDEELEAMASAKADEILSNLNWKYCSFKIRF